MIAPASGKLAQEVPAEMAAAKARNPIVHAAPARRPAPAAAKKNE
jgi:hypothetical protein